MLIEDFYKQSLLDYKLFLLKDNKANSFSASENILIPDSNVSINISNLLELRFTSYS